MLLWNQASADPIRAAEALIKLEAREARLLGLDMPTKLAVTEPEGNGIPLEAIRLVMDRFDRANAEAVDVTRICRSRRFSRWIGVGCSVNSGAGRSAMAPRTSDRRANPRQPTLIPPFGSPE